MTTDLDTRMRSAAESLVRESERLSPAGPPRSLRGVATAAAGVVVAVGLVAGTVAVLSGGGGTGQNDTATASAVPRLVSDVVPDGLRPAGVVEVPTDGGGDPMQSISVYGDPGADDPFAVSDLAILTTTEPLLTDQFPPEEGGETVDVRGHDGFVTDGALPLATTVLWEEAEGLTIGVASRSLDVDQLVSIAEGLAVDVEARTVDLGSLPPDLPGRLDPIASAGIDEVTYGFAALGLPVGESTAGHLAAYVPAEYEPFGHAFVAAISGDAADLALLRWASGAVSATEVRGHQAWSMSYELPGFDDGEGIVPGSQGPLSALVWEEAPGALVLVQTFGPSEDEARAIAESLRPATDDEWARMLRLGESGDRFMSLEERVAAGQQPLLEGRDDAHVEQPRYAINGSEGVYGDAGVWSTWLEPDGGLCGAVAEIGGAVVDGYLVDTAETCDTQGGPATVVRDNAGEPVLLIGVMPEDAIGRVPVGGEIVEIQTCTGPEDAPAYYIMVIADGELPSAVTFVGGDGTDLETVPVEP